LTGLEKEKIEEEHREQLATIADLTSLLADRQLILKKIKHELKVVMSKHGDARRSAIIPAAEGTFRHEDLIPDEPMAIFMTEQGYIKRLPLDTFEKQRRGGRGLTGMGIRDDDYIKLFFVGTAHTPVLFFSDRGYAYVLKIYELPESGRTAKGSGINMLLPLQPGEIITAVVPIAGFDDGHSLICLTRRGTIKKTELSAFRNIRKNGLIAISLDGEDELRWVRLTDGKQHVVIGTADGMAIHFPESEVRNTGRGAMGVRAITLREGDRMVGMEVSSAGTDLLAVTTDGHGKRTPLQEYRPQSRGGIGLLNMKLTGTRRQAKVAGVLVVSEEDEVVIVTTNGIVIRQRVKEIPRLGRSTQGCRLQRIGTDDQVAGVALVALKDEEESEPLDAPLPLS
jgi:DNA gyrase subunit A